MSSPETNNKEQNEYVKLPYFGLPKLAPFLKKYIGTIAIMIMFGLVGSALDIVLPLFQQYAINNFITEKTADGIWVFAALYLLAMLTQVVANAITTINASKMEMRIGRDMKKASFHHLQTLAFPYYNQNNVGYIHSRVMSDTNHIGNLVSWGMMDALWNLSYIIGAAAVMLVVNAYLAMWVLIIVPLTAVGAALFQKKLVFYHRRIREVNSKITADFNEGITGAKTAKTLVVEDKMAADFEEKAVEMRRISGKSGHYKALFSALISFASFFALALVLWQGGIITSEDVIKVGTLSLFMSYAMGMMEPIQWAVRAISDMITVQVNIERYTRLLSTESEVTDTPEVVEKYGDTFNPKRENWEDIHGDIEFDNVSFKYPDGDEYILTDFNLKVARGQCVAIVGETGAGKSTLVNLVCRFYEPTSGRVLIDGRDSRERSQLWLHSNIGYVLQTPHLFSGSVADNLRYGRPDATEEELWEAIRSVSAEGVVERLEKGLQSDVGEGGDMLSTGEKQLLSFARAILANPRIFVLDEATSSIDTKTEYLIQSAIEKVMEGRTTFIIAHRLSTIRSADIILAVKDGKIVESGTHAELMAKGDGGYYHDLYNNQYKQEATATALS